jgi:hypothetical protein
VTIISSERLIDEINDIDEAVGGRIFELSSKGGFLVNVKKDGNRNYRRSKAKEV